MHFMFAPFDLALMTLHPPPRPLAHAANVQRGKAELAAAAKTPCLDS
jgi:hypothetical protein